ncbi:MAG: branched-chain amino acid ABC transporter substrate-binding protein [Firmicutes bacterium]|jgi:branched-chain amino acid transport system substrate-binding protein|nr:branched-chain amino acid ABC transporter substrate-binding protein [Bacillota bacterium]
MSRSRGIALFLLAIMIVGVGGCAQPKAEEKKPAAPAEPIKIGVQGPISGQWAFEGEGIARAVNLVAEQVNEKGGVLGRKIQVIQGDDKSDPKESALVAQKMVAEKVIAVVGSYASSLTEPASAIYDEAGIVHITPSSTATKLTTKGYKRFFRTCFLDDRQGLFAAEYFSKKGYKNLAVIHDNTTYAKGLAEWTKKYLEERGVKVVFFDAITPGEKDFTPTLTKVKAANPDAIYFTGYFPEGGLLCKQAKELKIQALFSGGNAVNNPEFVKIAGLDAAKGAIVTTEPLPGDLPYPEAKQFMEDYKKKYGDYPKSIWVILAADAMRLIVTAMEKTGSAEPAKIAEYLHTQVKDFPGISGPIIGFDEKGDRLGTIHKAYVVDDRGEFVPAP